MNVMTINTDTRKNFTHFHDSNQVYEVLNEMRARHRYDYASLINIIIKQITNYYNKNKASFKENKPPKLKFVIGLSGGLDSSVVTYLATKAVGADNVIPLTMPARDDDNESILNSELVRNQLGISNPKIQYVIPIGEIVKKEIQVINNLKNDILRINTVPHSQSYIDKIRIGNFASRTRIAILYDLAKKLNGRVLGTANKPEIFQGFAAKYGTPISFDYGILDDLYKVDIVEIAKILKVPKQILNSIPTTGYFAGQTHEQELGATLEEQDVITYLLSENNLNLKTIVTKYGVNKDFVQLMLNRYKNSAHKRTLRPEHIKINI